MYTRMIPATDPRLKRHVQHDDRSLAFAAPVIPRSALQPQHWPRRCAVLDQGSIGSCTGQAAAGWLGTDNAARPGRADVTEATALDLYHWATVLDDFDGTYPPTDTGSSGLGAAKALQHEGDCTGYTHAFVLAALNTALQTGPVLAGTVWHESMFDPGSDGRIPVDTRSAVAGGHEYLIDGYEPRSGPDDRYWITNSWGTGWAQQGRAWFTGADLAALLADDGDVTVPAAAVVTPQPVDADHAFAAALRQYGWVTARHTGGNAYVATQGRAWLAAKGL